MTTHSNPNGTDPNGQSPEGALPSLPIRLLQALFSPGRLMERLAEEPRWAGAFFATVAVVIASLVVLPPDLVLETQRQAALEAGRDFPAASDEMIAFVRFGMPVFAALGASAMMFAFAGVFALVFVFVLGDEGRYRQYLAALSHAWFIPALFGLLITPLRIMTGDLQLTLNLASFFFFLPDGYLYNVLRALDLTLIWSTLVFAQGAHAIDKRRTFGSAATILLVLIVLWVCFVTAVVQRFAG